jgi:hypothetical protein
MSLQELKEQAFKLSVSDRLALIRFNLYKLLAKQKIGNI